jgi:hypothetical protein
MSKIQELWTRFKVQISFIGGALVVMTSHGSCTFEPAAPAAEVTTEEITSDVTVNDVVDVVVEIDETIEDINNTDANNAGTDVELDAETTVE